MLPKDQYMRLSKKQKDAVKRKLASGSGAYKFGKDKPFGHYGEKIGKFVGRYAGIPFAREIGAYGGHLLGKAFGSGAYVNSRGKYIPSYRGAHKVIKGSGAYYDAPKDVATNATSPPSFGSNRTIVRHREFIGNIQGSTGFAINTWNVNPGDEATFPWLNALAANYEKYRPIGIIFEFKSTSANALNSTNTALGTVMLAPRYNAIAASVPESKMEMLQIENCVSVCPAESAMCGIECAKNYNPLGILYNRTGGEIPAGSEQLYDFCDFYLATEGMQAVATIGELWVTYEIELLTPILSGGQIGDTVNFANYSLATGNTATTLLTGASDSLNISNMTLTFPAANQFKFPNNIVTGTYLCYIFVVGNSTANVLGITGSAISNCTANSIFSGNTVSAIISPDAASTVSRSMGIFSVSITGPGAVVQFNGSVIPASYSSGNLIVTQLPDH